MAKVTGPLMSLDASGTVGKTAVFSKWKGRNYVRLRVTPTNRQTDPQQDARIKTGSVGRSMSIVTKPIAPNLGSQFYLDAKVKAPAGQSWVSYSIRTIIGSAFSTFDDDATDFAGITAPNDGYYTTNADDAGLADFSIAKTGTVSLITKGEQLYHLYTFAVNQLSYAAPALGFALATDNELADFVEYLTTQVTP
jgi:hypothetical protein